MSVTTLTELPSSAPHVMAASATINAASRGIIHVPRRFVAHEWGGTETVILEISRQQQRRGLDPRILSSRALSNVPLEKMSGIPVKRFKHCYPFFGLDNEAKKMMDKKGGNLLSLSLYKALLTERDVRLYHAHALNRLGGMVRSAARIRRKPLVVSVHGGVFDVPTGEQESLLKPIQGKFEWGRIFGAAWGARRVLDEADMVIFVGKAEAEKAASKLGHDRIAYLPNGVDFSRFAQGDGASFRAAHGIAQDAFLVMSIGRIDAQKNQMLLLDSFAKMAAKAPQAQLVLMGPVTQQAYADKLEAFINQHGLQGRVHLLPGLRSDDPELVNAYHACDVFVLPSMHEPFGIVVLEAWSAGKPVIVSRVGGLSSLVEEDETGVFIDPTSPTVADDLTSKLMMLKNSPFLKTRLAEAGREKARTRYDWSQIAVELEAIYQKAEINFSKRLRKAL